MTEAHGSCMCGQVKYAVLGLIVQIVACHCSLCRRMTGAAFSSYVVVKADQFAITHGQDMLASYAVTERTTRHFCTICGTPIYNSNPHTYRGLAMLYLGTIQKHEDLAPRINIFCESKLQWVNVNESSKSFPRTPRDA